VRRSASDGSFGNGQSGREAEHLGDPAGNGRRSRRERGDQRPATLPARANGFHRKVRTRPQTSSASEPQESSLAGNARNAVRFRKALGERHI